jgi:hypothetical protein
LLLLNSTNGDNAYTAQLVKSTYAGIPFQTLQQFSGPLAVTVQNGVVNSISVTLQFEPQINTVRANVGGSLFKALHSSESRGATEVNQGDNFRVDITPDNTGPSSNGLFLVLASYTFNSDTDAGNVAYANPYPTSWTPFVDYYDSAIQNLLPPGAASPFPMPILNRVVTDVFPAASNPIIPLIGPALNPQINGVSVFQDQVISNTTPILSWQPPALGSAYVYYIQVQQFVVTNGTPSLQFKGQLSTTNTSLALPQGLLSSGNSYCFVIESLSRKNLNSSVAPYLETFPEGAADLVSGVITVQ